MSMYGATPADWSQPGVSLMPQIARAEAGYLPLFTHHRHAAALTMYVADPPLLSPACVVC